MRRSSVFYLVNVIVGLMAAVPELAAQPFSGHKQAVQSAQANATDRDLMEITVRGLEKLYAKHRYTVTEVTQWYLDRIARYDGTYRAMLYVDKEGALRRAAEEDAEAKDAKHGELWGVPIVVKANTSVKGWVTSAGWKGFLKPGEELVAPQDAMVVRRLREAGAVLLGQTNMPDFAFSDTTVSTAGGRTGDAYDVRYSPGGSSGTTASSACCRPGGLRALPELIRWIGCGTIRDRWRGM
jgi:amidase